MLTILISIFSTILTPISSLVSNLFSSYFNKEATVEVASIEGMATVEKQWWFVALTIPLFALPYILYVWKAVAWDKILGPFFGFESSTDPINGTLGWVFITVVSGIFLHAISTKGSR